MCCMVIVAWCKPDAALCVRVAAANLRRHCGRNRSQGTAPLVLFSYRRAGGLTVTCRPQAAMPLVQCCQHAPRSFQCVGLAITAVTLDRTHHASAGIRMLTVEPVSLSKPEANHAGAAAGRGGQLESESEVRAQRAHGTRPDFAPRRRPAAGGRRHRRVRWRRRRMEGGAYFGFLSGRFPVSGTNQ